MTTYNFRYIHSKNSFSETKELNAFADAIQFAADQSYLLIDEAGFINNDALGKFQRVEIDHIPTNFQIAALSVDQIIAVKKAVQLIKYPQLINKNEIKDQNSCSNFMLQVFFGGKDYQSQAVEILSIMADLYLMEFNVPDEAFICPPTYLNIADAKRDLQYLAEFCKIAQFQLQGTDIKSW